MGDGRRAKISHFLALFCAKLQNANVGEGVVIHRNWAIFGGKIGKVTPPTNRSGRVLN